MKIDISRDIKESKEALQMAQKAWESMAKFRLDRARNKRYTYGRQWSDVITVDGERITEEEYIRRQGSLPLKNNLIRRLVRNVLGVFRNSWQLPRSVARDEKESPMADVLNVLLDYNVSLNRMEELYARTLEEFLISGLVVHRKWYGERRGRVDCWTDYVSPDNFFVDSSTGDFRGWDVSCIGELHDMKFPELCAYLAKTDEDVEFLRRVYEQERFETANEFGQGREGGGFYYSGISGVCRVIEVWHRETRRVMNCNIEEWVMYCFASDGTLLRKEVSPYPGCQHPYVFKAYPYIDGEIHSFVADIIDQQRYTNRLITLYDWVMRSSAKGVLLFPEGCLPEGGDIEDIADQWSRFNGVIEYRPRSGVPLPQQVSSNASNVGITDLLQIQLKMLEDVSGVNGALQGRLESGSVSGTLYEQQTRNSMTALQDLLSSYQGFIIDCTAKDAANMHHFYPEDKIVQIAGEGAEIFCGKVMSRYGDPALDFTFER